MSCLENEADMARFYEAMPAMPPVIKYLSSFEKKPQSAMSCGFVNDAIRNQGAVSEEASRSLS